VGAGAGWAAESTATPAADRADRRPHPGPHLGASRRKPHNPREIQGPRGGQSPDRRIGRKATRPPAGGHHMHDSTWMTRTRWWPRMRPRLLMAASLLTVVWLLATACTRATGTAQATAPGTDVVAAELAEGTWQGTFEVDGQLSNVPAHVGSAGCTAIGLMALDLHQGAIGTQSGVSGRLRVWAVTVSGTAGTHVGAATAAADRCRAHSRATARACWPTASACLASPMAGLSRRSGTFRWARRCRSSRCRDGSAAGAVTTGPSRGPSPFPHLWPELTSARWSGHTRDVLCHGSLLRLTLGPLKLLSRAIRGRLTS
jgi:hypothetical protein